MTGDQSRRDFLKTASAAAGAVAAVSAVDVSAQKPADVQIGRASYQPVRDYPIRPQAYSAVTLTDDFWKPKVDLNAAVTIPFEVRKRLEGTGRGFGAACSRRRFCRSRRIRTRRCRRRSTRACSRWRGRR